MDVSFRYHNIVQDCKKVQALSQIDSLSLIDKYRKDIVEKEKVIKITEDWRDGKLFDVLVIEYN